MLNLKNNKNKNKVNLIYFELSSITNIYKLSQHKMDYWI